MALRPAAATSTARRRTASWTSAFAASKAASRRGSPNLHEFSTVPTIKGGYDVWELFTEFNLPLWESDSPHGSRSTSRRAARTTRRAAASTPTRPASTCRSPSSCGSARRCRATFASRRSPSGSTCKAAAAASPSTHVNNNRRRSRSPTVFQITATRSSELARGSRHDHGRLRLRAGKTGLQFSVDWYDIDLADAIGQLGVQRHRQRVRRQACRAAVQLISATPSRSAITRRAQRVPEHRPSARVRGLDYELLWNRDPDLLGNQDESLTLPVPRGPVARGQHDVARGGGRLRDDRQRESISTSPTSKRSRRCATRSAPSASNWQQRYVPETVLNVTWLEWQPGIVLPTPGTITVDDNTVEGQTNTDLTFLYDASQRSADARGVCRSPSATCSTSIRPSLPSSANAPARKSPRPARRSTASTSTGGVTC